MATTTANLGLTKPEYTEKADIAVINNNMDMIDYATKRRDRVWNLLDNSDFRNPVNERGQASYTGTYGIDRWRVWLTGTMKLENGGLTVQNESMFQYFELGRLENKNHTLAAMTTNGELFLYIRNPHDDYGWGENGLGLGIDEARHVIGLSPGRTYAWAALYVGEYTAETLPAYVPKGYAAELMECRRYYYEFDALVSSESSGIGAPRRMFVTLPVPMIRMPGITYGVTGGNAPHEIAMQSTYTVDITSADQGFSHLSVKLSADL